jgi:hypothetical protein
MAIGRQRCTIGKTLHFLRFLWQEMQRMGSAGLPEVPD